jgi:hypothetical protein
LVYQGWVSTPTSSEKPKRLSPTKETIREVAALSGNVCAFEGCDHEVIDQNGRFVLQLCHIEAAEPAGERFNPDMTNEERRAPANLMFMCLRHHVETNDTKAWPVERLQDLKRRHEAKFRGQETRIPDAAIADITKAVELGQPQNMLRFGEYVDPGLTPDENLETLNVMVRPMLERLRKLAPETRRLFEIVVDRGEDYREDLGLRCAELEQVTGLDPADIKPHVVTMERYGIAALEEGDWDGEWWVVSHSLGGWEFWRNLRDFCHDTGLDLRDFIIDLRFDLLDH